MSDALILLSLVLGPLGLGFGFGALVARRRGRAHQLRTLPTSKLHQLEVEAGIRKPDPFKQFRDGRVGWFDADGELRAVEEWDPYDFTQEVWPKGRSLRERGPRRVHSIRCSCLRCDPDAPTA